MKEKLKYFGWSLLILPGWMLVYVLTGWLASKQILSSVESSWDTQIPFTPEWIWVYTTVYFYPFLPAFFVKDKEEFFQVMRAFLYLSCVAFLFFALLPTKAPRPEIVTNTLSSWWIRFVFQVDTPYNCFPSLHVGAAWLVSFMFWKWNKSLCFFLCFYAGLISVSTLFVKQHFIADVLVGILLAFFFYVWKFHFVVKDSNKSSVELQTEMNQF